MAIYRETVTITGTTGGAGASTATGYTTKIVSGVVTAVYLAYTGSPPATTDITIEERHQSPALPVLAVSNANTDGWFYPAVTNQISGSSSVVADDYLKIVIAQADDNDGVTVTIVWMSQD